MMKQLPDGEIRSLVGHSKDMDTWGVYSHQLDGDGQRIATKMEGILSAIFESGLQSGLRDEKTALEMAF